MLAAAVVALPMMYVPAKAAFAAVERELEEIARLFGASKRQVFWHVSLPLARRGILSGALLGFARALGEFGATVMVLGWLPNRLTLPISIYHDYVGDQLPRAYVSRAVRSHLRRILNSGQCPVRSRARNETTSIYDNVERRVLSDR